jgi:hypothetical protein
MASQTDLGAQERAAALRDRQRRQRAALVDVAAAIERVRAAEAREVIRLAIDRAERELQALKAQMAALVEQQKAQLPSARRLGSVLAERTAAGARMADAVAAFGSITAAAEALGVPVRTVRRYLQHHQKAQAAANDAGAAGEAVPALLGLSESAADPNLRSGSSASDGARDPAG